MGKCVFQYNGIIEIHYIKIHFFLYEYITFIIYITYITYS